MAEHKQELGTPSTQNQNNPGASCTQLTFLGSHFSSCGRELGDQVGKHAIYPNHLRRIYVVSDDLCLETALLRVSPRKREVNISLDFPTYLADWVTDSIEAYPPLIV